MSPPRKKFHAENRLIVCAVCWKKSSSMRPVAASGLDRIKKYHNPDYDPCDDRQPTALCSRCNNLLLQIDAGAKSPRSLPPVFDISIVQKTPTTRYTEFCNCFICETARFCPVGVPDNHQKIQPYPLGRPPSMVDPLPPPLTVPVCQRCLSIVGRGMPHNCTLSQRRQNLSGEFHADPRGFEILASDALKEKVVQAHGSGTGIIKLATRGRDLSFPVSSQSASHGSFPSKPIPLEEMRRLQNQAGLSLEQTKTTAQFLRQWKGRQCVCPQLLPELRGLDHKLADVYTV